MNAPVAVVIPCYRNTRTIARAVASVSAQTVLPEELILVDDASGDGSVEHLRATLATLPAGVRGRLVECARNGGPGPARNAGWAVATSRYIAFLDADDTWHPRKLEVQCAFMEAHPEAALSGDAHRWLRRPGQAVDVPAPGFDEVSRTGLLLRNRFAPSSVVLRRDLRRRFRDGLRQMEDHLLWMQIACDGGRLFRLRATLSYRHAAPFGEAGVSGNLRAMAREERENYRRLADEGLLARPLAMALVAWATLKYCRRVVVVAIRRGGWA